MNKKIIIACSVLMLALLVFNVFGRNNLPAENKQTPHFSVHVGSGNQSGASVTVKNSSGSIVMGPASTDANGWVSFIVGGLPSGNYTILASKGLGCVNEVVYYDVTIPDSIFYVTLGACQD